MNVKHMNAAGQDTTESAAKLRSWQEQQKDFVKQTGLKRQSAREQIAGDTGKKAVASGGRSGIISLNRNVKRKEKNVGTFSNLQVPMQKREVKRIAKKYGVDISGITIKIQRSEKLLALPTTGMTCGSLKTNHGFTVINKSTRAGYGEIWCETCRRGVHLSRMIVPKGAKEENAPDGIRYD